MLPEAFANDPDRLARFAREAQVLASLNHPNIGHVYGFEDAPVDGLRAGSSELNEGPTLPDSSWGRALRRAAMITRSPSRARLRSRSKRHTSTVSSIAI